MQFVLWGFCAYLSMREQALIDLLPLIVIARRFVLRLKLFEQWAFRIEKSYVASVILLVLLFRYFEQFGLRDQSLASGSVMKRSSQNVVDLLTVPFKAIYLPEVSKTCYAVLEVFKCLINERLSQGTKIEEASSFLWQVALGASVIWSVEVLNHKTPWRIRVLQGSNYKMECLRTEHSQLIQNDTVFEYLIVAVSRNIIWPIETIAWWKQDE